MSNYGEELKYQREKRNKTLKQIEQDTEISTANLSRWENGKVLPNIDFCVILADYYGISLDELIGRDTNDK
jgi:transcriptional regulator with XRE-family HTH domain